MSRFLARCFVVLAVAFGGLASVSASAFADPVFPSQDLKGALEELERIALDGRNSLRLLRNQMTNPPFPISARNQESAISGYTRQACDRLGELRFEGVRARKFAESESARLSEKDQKSLKEVFRLQDDKIPGYEERCAKGLSSLGFGEQADLENALEPIQSRAAKLAKKLGKS